MPTKGWCGSELLTKDTFLGNIFIKRKVKSLKNENYTLLWEKYGKIFILKSFLKCIKEKFWKYAGDMESKRTPCTWASVPELR